MSDRRDRGFVSASTLIRPGWIGRSVRLVLGVVLLVAVAPIVPDLPYFLRATALPGNLTLWVFTAILFFASKEVVNLGLGVSWGRWPQIVPAALAVVAVAIDLLVYGRVWAPPLGLLFYLWMVGVSLPLGIAFVLSALLGTPGCEMRAYADLWARVRGRDASEHHCPGGIDVVDRWEARVRRR